MNTYDGRESPSRTRSKNPFCFESIRAQIQGRGVYIASSMELIRGGELFTHIIFLPFSPNYFFLRNSVRRDDDRVFVYVPFPLKAWG